MLQKKYQVLVIGLENDRNLGDAVINDCTKFLVEKYFIRQGIDASVRSYDLFERAFRGNLLIKCADVIVFAGGGLLKFNYLKIYERVSRILEVARRERVPVIFLGTGIEGYDEEDSRCLLLKEFINDGVVKWITTRDDLETLQNKYIYNTGIKTGRVADSAVFANEVYGIEKKTDSKTVGIGVIRGAIFQDNEVDFTEEQELDFLEKCIIKLKERQIAWKLFCNGLPQDYEFVLKLTERLGETEDKICPVPNDGRDLVRLISGFGSVLAFRLHACIISYSLDIPCVGMVWNRKVKMFYDIIGQPQQAVALEDIDADSVVNKVTERLGKASGKDTGIAGIVRSGFRKRYRHTTEKLLEKALKPLVKDYCRYRGLSFENRKIILFGIGKKAFEENVDQTFYDRVSYFVDTNPKNWLSTFCEKTVYSPERIKYETKGSYFVFVARNPDYNRAAALLESYGLKEHYDFAGVYQVRNYANMQDFYLWTDWETVGTEEP